MSTSSDWDRDGTPDYAAFRKLYEADDNIWWAVGCGHHQNAYEGALDEIDRLVADNERLATELASVLNVPVKR